MAPATPTGLHVDETTETSITWHWTAVEGALGYVVQANMDEMWDETDTVLFDGAPFTTETSYTAMDLEPETTVYVRVAAAAGTPEAPLVSAFTTHVSGTSAMPPPDPPPPPPAAVMAMFSLSDDAKSKYFLIADKDDDDKATAMATVNTEIMVESNTSAVITPMFVEDASGVSVAEGSDNMPFAFVDWGLLQSAVLDGGATFMIQRTTMGVNQEMEPTGDIAYVTCGPFNCSESSNDEPPPAPELSIADSGVCNDWEADIQLQIGFVDNTAMNLDPDGAGTPGDPDGDATLDDGIDVGWVYTSNTDLEVMHHFGGTLTLEAKAKKASRATALSVSGGGPALVHAVKTVTGATRPTPEVTLETLFDVPSGGAPTERWACNSTGTDVRATDPASDYNPANLSVTMPDECFRISANGVNYLADYTIELAAAGSAVSWGAVDWGEGDDNPFDGLTCDTMTVAAADEVDVCDLFEDEVDRALEAGWGGAEGYLDAAAGSDTFTVDVTTETANVPSSGELNWEAESKSGPRQFSTIWYDIDGSGKPTDDLYNDTDDGSETGQNAVANGRETTPNRDGLVVELLDDDGDPMYGDIGKIDIRKKGTGSSAVKNDTSGSDGTADNYSDGNAKCSDDDGADGCDAKVVIEKEYTFVSGTAFECEADRTLKIECTWDAQGQMNLAASGNLSATKFVGDFLACKVLDP
ncbi:MAG: fibronectin type III domain-containing protein [Acidobacteria bacterium]|nr:fibronectin type III domain-containing protein [Acidobacteriota bacterium]